jgi:hypothetical protein
MEPITVIALPLWAMEHGEKLCYVQVEVMDPVPCPNTPDRFVSIDCIKPRTVTLEFVPIRLRDKHSWLVMVDDDELALKLQPSWLPGQQGAINDYKRINRELSRVLLDVLARGVGGH